MTAFEFVFPLFGLLVGLSFAEMLSGLALLARSGTSFDGVVELTTFHTDIAAQMDGFITVKHRYIREPFPAWTAIDIDRLVPDGGLVEIKIVARRPSAARTD